jgi:NADPH-dependent 2,4-dienoyl-CoA reductase/sulfur reductase-like enzyme
MGVGVRPLTALAETAGSPSRRDVVVDEFLRASEAPDIYAAGDIARYPVPGGSQRIEHWVLAQQQGQVAAATCSAARSRFAPCRSSGASTTTWPSTWWATPSAGTGIDIAAASRAATR